MRGERLKPVSGAAITVWTVVGLVGGWLLKRLLESWRGVAPLVTWAQPLILLLIAAILAGTAWITWRQVHVRQERIEPHRAVNRLVLARACTMVGALLAGGYLGYAVSWLWQHGDPLAPQQVARSALAAFAGAMIVLGARLLEHACRVRRDEDEEG